MAEQVSIQKESRSGNHWSGDERLAIVEELKRLLEDPNFKHSKRCVALLTWLVEHALAGNFDAPKERTLGVAVFGRSADYDTNNDPIVRMAANEVRKRLAMYYEDPICRSRSTVRIRLVPGSYQPEFDFRHASPPVQVTSSDSKQGEIAESDTLLVHRDVPDSMNLGIQDAESVPLELERSGEAQRNDGKPGAISSPLEFERTLESAAGRGKPWKTALLKKRLTMVIVGAALLLIAAFLIRVPPSFMRSTQYMAWEPLLSSGTAPIICIAQDNAAQPRSAETQTGNSTNLPNNGPQINPTVSPSLYSFADLNVAHKVALWFAHYGKDASLRQPQDIGLWEFHHQPGVLIGTGVNMWPAIFLSGLRFSPQMDEATGRLWVRDSQNPGRSEWTQSLGNGDSPTADFAIITRYLNADTGNWIFSIDGLGQHGTEAAGELMVDPSLSKDLPAEVRSSKNFQVVVKTSVIKGKTGLPRIVAFYAW